MNTYLNKNDQYFYLFMSTAVLLILAIPVGFANMYLGYYHNESPCTLCWFERIGMIIIGVLGMLILRYGPQIKYIVCVFLFAGYGIYMGIRHTASWWQRDIGIGLGDKLVGAHTYTWAVVVYWCVVVVMGLALLFIRKNSSMMQDLVNEKISVKPLNGYSKLVIILSFIVVCSNAFQALIINGIPPYTGKSNPDRMTFDMSIMSKTWTTEVWTRITKFNLLGKNVPENVYIKDIIEPKDLIIEKDPSKGAFELSKSLQNLETIEIIIPELAKYKNINALAYDKTNDEFALVSNEMAVSYTKDFKSSNGHVLFDKTNGNDMKYIVDATFIGDKFVIGAFNKTFSGTQKTEKEIDPMLEWQTFKETSGGISPAFYTKKNEWFEPSRKYILTIRAKQNYVHSYANGGEFLYLITIPNKFSKKLILSYASTKDYLLSGEKIISVDENLKLKDGRDINDYYIVGAEIDNGKMLALSLRYSTLLIIDYKNAKITDAYAISGLDNPKSLAIKNDIIYILDRTNDKKDVIKTYKNPL
ncbi:disulfide bond formation protein B [Campylobacter lari]|uniref:disulfide bond formation protein B n=1 Tax=Campylobacter lari TaxID=201 RepID=UPI00127FB717|nr:disulfide bond formation protein B [Campylobacter lari]EAK0438280.1 disulfide bond formation protein B [Campylobacter lari]EAK0438842.1 disulfide bond formation protein B [Campylobacter lari]EEA6126050.1 disulfide bond formation protein B [Campylobacter lari]EEA6126791.1 disulfide bond formation protein B [Campylobacter lari]